MLNYQRVSGCLTSFNHVTSTGRQTAPPQIHHRSTSQRRDIVPCRHPPHGGNHTFPRASPCGFTLNPVRHGANMAWKTEGFHAKNGEMTMKHVDFEWLLFENAGGGGAGRGCAKYSYVDLDKSIFGLQIFRQLWCRQQHTYLQHETSLKPPRAMYIPIIIACPSFFWLVQFPWFVPFESTNQQYLNPRLRTSFGTPPTEVKPRRGNEGLR